MMIRRGMAAMVFGLLLIGGRGPLSPAQVVERPDFQPPDVVITGEDLFKLDERREDAYRPRERPLPSVGAETGLPQTLRTLPELRPTPLALEERVDGASPVFDTTLALSQGNYWTNFFDGAHLGIIDPWDYAIHVKENYTRGHRSRSEYWEVQADAEAGYRLSPMTRLFLETENLVKEYELPLAEKGAEILAHRSKVIPGIESDIGDNLRLELRPFFSYSTLHTRDRALLPPGARDDDDQRQAVRFGLSGGVNYDLGEMHRLRLSGEHWRENVDSEKSDIDYANTVSRFLVEDEILWLEDFSTRVGIGYARHDNFDDEWTPRFGFSWRPLPFAEFYGGIERRYTVRTFDELYVDPDYVEVNDELEPEQEWSYRLGFRTAYEDWVLIKLEYFRREIENYIYYQEVIPGGDLSRSDGLWQPQNLRNDVLIQGLEVKIDLKRWNAVQPYVVYRFSDAEDRNSASGQVPFYPEHELEVGLTFFLERYGIEGELVGQFVGEQYSDSAGSNDFLLDDYWLWRARLSKSIGRHFSVFLTVDNIFDEYYETRRGYYLPGTSFTIGGAARF